MCCSYIVQDAYSEILIRGTSKTNERFKFLSRSFSGIGKGSDFFIQIECQEEKVNFEYLAENMIG